MCSYPSVKGKMSFFYKRVIGGLSFLLVDSDSDNFQSLKKTSKSKQNGTAKTTKADAKQSGKSPVKPSSTQGKTTPKSPPVPSTPKSAPPPQSKQTPTSVLDYFGSASVQRSDKKLVASTKRKAVSTEALLLCVFPCFFYSSSHDSVTILCKNSSADSHRRPDKR